MRKHTYEGFRACCGAIRMLSSLLLNPSSTMTQGHEHQIQQIMSSLPNPSMCIRLYSTIQNDLFSNPLCAQVDRQQAVYRLCRKTAPNQCINHSSGLLACYFRIMGLILSWVGFLVVVEFDESVITSSHQRTQKWPYPIYPMIP